MSRFCRQVVSHCVVCLFLPLLLCCISTLRVSHCVVCLFLPLLLCCISTLRVSHCVVCLFLPLLLCCMSTLRSHSQMNVENVKYQTRFLAVHNSAANVLIQSSIQHNVHIPKATMFAVCRAADLILYPFQTDRQL